MRSKRALRQLARRELRRLSRRERLSLSRRELLKMGLVASGGLLLPVGRARADDDSQSPPVTPFERDMPVPGVLDPVGAFSVGPPQPQCALEVPGFPDLPPPLLYEIPVEFGMQELIPGLPTEVWGYTGVYPAPTISVTRNQPIVVRFINNIDVELSTHNHGGHTAEESDGFPNFFIEPGHFRDYCYPNVAPDDDDADFTSTQWYHDHAMDITGENVYMGLAGFYLLTDNLEQSLNLPRDEFDVPMVFQDRLFDADGTLIYDPMDHDGVIGDRFLVNGVIQPRFHVQRTQYRFRILNGCNARVLALKRSDGQPLLQIAADSWLLPHAIEVPHLLLSPAERAEVIIDFSDMPPGTELFLTNHLTHGLDDGRGPEEDVDEPEDWPQQGPPWLKLIVDGSPAGGGTPSLSSRRRTMKIRSANAGTIQPGDPLRPHNPISPDEIVRTRTFEFERSHGAWVVNGEFFDPDRDDADPELGTAERWIIENGSGGWVHPIHIHLEGQQIQQINEGPPPPELAAKKDTILLGNFDAEVFIKFRTFPGRFVFHCHNVEHEDMRMMGVFNVQP